MKRFALAAARHLAPLLALVAPLAQAPARADELPEYRLKAAFLYNFAQYTDWPSEVGATLNLCVDGPDPFGAEIDTLQGKAVGARSIAVQRRGATAPLRDCQVVFVSAAAIATLPRVIEELRDCPTLVVADSPGAAHRGAALNMAVANQKITFEANLQAARAARLVLSSKLLHLATEVQQ